MKILTLHGGKQLEVSDLSTFGDIITVVKSKEAIGKYWEQFTTLTLTDAHLNDDKFSAIPTTLRADADPVSGNFTVHCINEVTDPIPVYPEFDEFDFNIPSEEVEPIETTEEESIAEDESTEPEEPNE